MSTIGTFTHQDNGYSGTLRTLSINTKCKIVPTEKDGANGPDFRVLAGTTEIGAAWKRQSKASREYLSVRIDDPIFPAPVDARLIDGEDGSCILYWSRRNDE